MPTPQQRNGRANEVRPRGLRACGCALGLVASLLATGCERSPVPLAPGGPTAESAQPSAPANATPELPLPIPVAAEVTAETAGGDDVTTVEPPRLLVEPARAAEILYADDEPGRLSAVSACLPAQATLDTLELDAARELVRCLLAARYAEDGKAAALARELYDAVEVVAGLEAAYTAEVGWRGVIDFVPELPVGSYREHLGWIVSGFDEIDRVLQALEAQAGKPLAYRWRGLELRFFRSVDRTTPSAYADRWYFGYNVVGSLLRSERGVRETVFHEIFHMNDAEHGDWSRTALVEIFEAILSECSRPGDELPSTSCLEPYAPGSTKVKGGTYYAFQPGNGVWEYAAELALRYFIEQRQALDGKKIAAPFKCGNERNAEAWSLLVAEFFAGADAVPACAND